MIKQPDEYIPSYLKFVFEKTDAWMCYMQTDGHCGFSIQAMRKAYRDDNLASAMIYAETNGLSAKERVDYRDRVLEVIQQRISNSEALMKDIIIRRRPKKLDLDRMVIKTYQEVLDGYLAGLATHNWFDYTVKIISPADYQYTFFYLTSNESFKERAIIILPFIMEIKERFEAGVGIMLSFAQVNNTSYPCFQRILVVSEMYSSRITSSDLKRLTKEYLHMAGTQMEMIKFPNLLEETKRFYGELKKKYYHER